MKSHLFIILLLSGLGATAQTYHPFPTKNTMWTEMYTNPYPDEYNKFHSFALKDRDTTINGKLYHKLYHSTDTLFTEGNLCGAIREENKRIYYYSIDSLPYLFMEIQEKKEVILYDFSLNLGDTLKSDSIRLVLNTNMIVEKIDTVLVGSDYRKVYTFAYPDFSPHLIIPWAQWVEGIGSLRGLLFLTGDLPTNGLFNDLVCFKQDKVWLYHLSKYNSCYYKNFDAVEVSKVNKITVTPNPAKTIANIEFNGVFYSKLIVTDSFGITLMVYPVEGMSSVEIKREGMPAGLYILTLQEKNGKIVTTKMIFD